MKQLLYWLKRNVNEVGQNRLLNDTKSCLSLYIVMTHPSYFKVIIDRNKRPNFLIPYNPLYRLPVATSFKLIGAKVSVEKAAQSKHHLNCNTEEALSQQKFY